jgi:hypothetical protein
MGSSSLRAHQNIINREKSMNAKLSLILRGKRRKWMKGVMMKETS